MELFIPYLRFPSHRACPVHCHFQVILLFFVPPDDPWHSNGSASFSSSNNISRDPQCFCQAAFVEFDGNTSREIEKLVQIKFCLPSTSDHGAAWNLLSRVQPFRDRVCAKKAFREPVPPCIHISLSLMWYIPRFSSHHLLPATTPKAHGRRMAPPDVHPKIWELELDSLCRHGFFLREIYEKLIWNHQNKERIDWSWFNLVAFFSRENVRMWQIIAVPRISERTMKLRCWTQFYLHIRTFLL